MGGEKRDKFVSSIPNMVAELLGNTSYDLFGFQFPRFLANKALT